MDDERGLECAYCGMQMFAAWDKCGGCGLVSCCSCAGLLDRHCDRCGDGSFYDDPPLTEEHQHVVRSPRAKVWAFVARLLPWR